MKNLFIYIPFLVLIILSCKNLKRVTTKDTNENQVEKTKDDLFKLEMIREENFVRITVSEESNFSFPDSAAKTEPYKVLDFNGDNKTDILVYLGACGTGGCIYGLFLNQYDNYYKLAFMDYLKGPQFEKEDKFWAIKSFEEVEPYNPSKLYVSVYKFDQDKNYYGLDTTFISIDE